MKRKPLTRLQRVRIFDAHHGTCCLCGGNIYNTGKPWIIEHLTPLWLGGADDETNMAPAHQHCAIEKTCGEAPVKAKTDRQRASHLGVKKKRSITRWRRFSGEIVTASRER